MFDRKKTLTFAIVAMALWYASGAVYAKGDYGKMSDFTNMRLGPTKVVPGGILYPNFNRAGELNAATIPWEWGKAVEVLYSPHTGTDDPHAGLLTFTSASKKRVGFGVGLMTSAYRDGSVWGGFLGGGIGSRKISAGFSFRQPNFRTSNTFSMDFGTMYEPGRYLDLGAVIRDLNHSPTAVLGIGSGRLMDFSTEVNLLYPLVSTIGTDAATFRVLISSTLKLWRFDLSATGTYSRFRSSQQLSRWTFTGAVATWLSQSLSLVLEHTTEPQVTSIGLSWFGYPKGYSRVRDYAHIWKKRK